MEENIDTIIAKYGKKVPKKPNTSRAVILSVIIILVVAGLAICAFMFFANKSSLTATTPPIVTTYDGPSAKDVVDAIAADPTVNDTKNYFLSRTSSTQSDPNSDISSIIYQENDYSFLTNVTAQDGLRFTLSNSKAISHKDAITAAMQALLKNQGFRPTTQDTSALSSYKFETYVKGGTVCQIVQYTGSEKVNLEQSVLCINHAGLEASYKNVQMLLTTADSALLSSTKTVTQTLVTDGTKTLLTLTVQPKSGTSTRYYFATLATNYEYLGNRPTPSVDNESSYTLSAQLKKSISDPKWGSFLTDNIK